MITPEQLGERYLAMHHRMFRAVNDGMSLCGLSMARTKVLMHLHEQGPTRQERAGEHLRAVPHSITDIVDALEARVRAGRAAKPKTPPTGGPSWSPSPRPARAAWA